MFGFGRRKNIGSAARALAPHFKGEFDAVANKFSRLERDLTLLGDGLGEIHSALSELNEVRVILEGLVRSVARVEALHSALEPSVVDLTQEDDDGDERVEVEEHPGFPDVGI